MEDVNLFPSSSPESLVQRAAAQTSCNVSCVRPLSIYLMACFLGCSGAQKIPGETSPQTHNAAAGHAPIWGNSGCELDNAAFCETFDPSVGGQEGR